MPLDSGATSYLFFFDGPAARCALDTEAHSSSPDMDKDICWLQRESITGITSERFAKLDLGGVCVCVFLSTVDLLAGSVQRRAFPSKRKVRGNWGRFDRGGWP